jgi:hypothetical protein
MATLQVTAWQLWGTHHKTGSMEHNQDTDAPVPADELLESPAILTRFLAAPFALRHSVLVFRPRFIRRPLFSPRLASPVPISLAQRSRPIADNSRRSVDDRGQCARAVCCPASASIDTTSAEWEGQWTLFERYFPERKGGAPRRI